MRRQRSPFQWGRVGSPRTAISNSSSSVTRWRMGSSRTTSSAPEACSSRSDVGISLIQWHLVCAWVPPESTTFSGKGMPGKTEVSFKQWYHKVQCVKDHYAESVVWESIAWSLTGAVAGMAWSMGPTASVWEILQKLMVIFGTVASFDVLMQNFYKVTQGNHEKVPSFATGWRALSTNLAKVPWENSGLGGGMALKN